MSVQKLKDALTQAPVLTIFDPALPRRVLADTSGFASGSILEQLVVGHWHPVEYFSNGYQVLKVAGRQLSEKCLVVSQLQKDGGHIQLVSLLKQ